MSFFCAVSASRGVCPLNMGISVTLPIQIGERSSQNGNWCDRLGVRVRCVMKWHGLYQSVSHSVVTVVPEYELPLRPAPLHTAVAQPLGKSHSPPSCLWVLFSPSSAFISTLQAASFHSIISSPPIRSVGEWGRGGGGVGGIVRGVEFFLSFLAPMAISHKALCPFRHAVFALISLS